MRWTKKSDDVHFFSLCVYALSYVLQLSNSSNDNWNIINDFSVSLLKAVLFLTDNYIVTIELFSDDNKTIL